MAYAKHNAANVNVDEILKSLKSFGFFQFSQFFLLTTMVIAINSHVFVIVFAGVTPDVKCKNLTEDILNNFTSINQRNQVVYGTCNIQLYRHDKDSVGIDNTSTIDSIECINGYEYNTFAERSIISEWNLVCDKNGLAEFTQTGFIVGQILGAVSFPILTEKFGRRPVHIFCGFLLMMTGLTCALSPNLWVFMVGRILSGTFTEGYCISGLTAICELFSTDRRSNMSAIFSLIWSSAMNVPDLVAYLIKDFSWRAYCFYAASTTMLFIVDIFFLEESIRWLFVNGKVMKAKKVIETACRQNGTDFKAVWSLAEKELGKTADDYVDENAIQTITVYIPNTKPETERERSPRNSLPGNSYQQTEKDSGKTESKLIKILNIFKYPYTRYITLINIFNWIAILTSYVSIYMLSEDLSGNMYLNYCLLAIMETIAAATYCIGVKRFGHKISIVFFEVLGAASLLSAFGIKRFLENSSTNKMIFKVLHMSAMLGIGASFGGIYIYTPELYPTEMRSVGLGISSSMSRIGTMVAPFLRVLVKYAEWAPSALLGSVLAVGSMLFIRFMPETSKIQLPQTLEELKEARKKEKDKNKSHQVYEKDVEE